jgi:hypothetical protein
MTATSRHELATLTMTDIERRDPERLALQGAVVANRSLQDKVWCPPSEIRPLSQAALT